MTDEQLIEEYSKEIFGALYSPDKPDYKITVQKIMRQLIWMMLRM